MDKIKPYDYLNGTIMSPENIADMVKINPYKRYMFFNTVEVSEHRQFNKVYYLGYMAGAFSKLNEISRLLREKGVEKEEIRLMLNAVLGQEIIKPETNE